MHRSLNTKMTPRVFPAPPTTRYAPIPHSPAPPTVPLRFRLLHQPFHPHAIDRHLPMPIAHEKNPLAVGREYGRHLTGVARPVLTNGELALHRPHQQQNVRRRLAFTRPHEDGRVG